MKVGFLVNDFKTIKPSQTTAEFMQKAGELGNDVFVFPVAGVSVDEDGQISCLARQSTVKETVSSSLEHLSASNEVRLQVCDFDRVLIRTNPGRFEWPQVHDDVLAMLATVEDKVPVINSPLGLRVTSTKFFLTQLPDWTRPRTIVTSDPKQLEAFVASEDQAAVLKPVRGTRGEGVFKVTSADPNLKAIIETLRQSGMIMAQSFVPDAVNGDTRVVVLDGEPLTIDGATLAINRLPTGSDFRSNIHVGGRAQPGVLTDGMRRVVAACAPLLKENGIRLAGFDFLGDVVCEINVYSTGGFGDGEKFFNRHFTAHVLDRLL